MRTSGNGHVKLIQPVNLQYDLVSTQHRAYTGWCARENLVAGLKGEHPPNLVNPEALGQRRR